MSTNKSNNNNDGDTIDVSNREKCEVLNRDENVNSILCKCQ